MARASWVSRSYDPGSRTCVGEYEGSPGKVSNLAARSFTTNRVKYRVRISELRTGLRRASRLASREPGVMGRAHGARAVVVGDGGD